MTHAQNTETQFNKAVTLEDKIIIGEALHTCKILMNPDPLIKFRDLLSIRDISNKFGRFKRHDAGKEAGIDYAICKIPISQIKAFKDAMKTRPYAIAQTTPAAAPELAAK